MGPYSLLDLTIFNSHPRFDCVARLRSPAALRRLHRASGPWTRKIQEYTAANIMSCMHLWNSHELVAAQLHERPKKTGHRVQIAATVLTLPSRSLTLALKPHPPSLHLCVSHCVCLASFLWLQISPHFAFSLARSLSLPFQSLPHPPSPLSAH